jgi:hypothetical protein
MKKYPGISILMKGNRMAQSNKNDKRKMNVVEIGDGSFYKALQDAFEDALHQANAYRQKMVFKAVITVLPPKQLRIGSRDIKSGGIQFEVQPANLKQKSIAYETEVDDDGYIIASGDSVMDLIQEDMSGVLMDDVNEKLAKFKGE